MNKIAFKKIKPFGLSGETLHGSMAWNLGLSAGSSLSHQLSWLTSLSSLPPLLSEGKTHDNMSGSG